MKWSWYILGGSIIALLVAIKVVVHLHNKAQYLSMALANASATIEARDKTITAMKSQLKKVQQLDIQLNQELNDAKQNIESLEHDIASGNKRLRVKAHCSAPVPHQSSSASMVNAGTCELDQDARQDYIRLRRELERVQLQVSGLQRFIRALPAQCVQPAEKDIGMKR